MNFRPFVLFFSPLLLYPLSVHGETSRTFSPKVLDYYGELRVEGFYRNERSESKGNTFSREDIIFRELLTLGLSGYIYHPRFISFLARASGGTEQEKIGTTTQREWEVDSAESYEFRGFLLPEHPYSLEAYTLLVTPLLTGRYGSSTHEHFESGAHLRYRKNPWSGTLSYITEENKGVRDDQTDTYRAQAGYNKGYFSLNGSYQHSELMADDGLEIFHDYYFAENQLRHDYATLSSNLQIDEEDRTESRIALERWRLLWTENLQLKLPLNFATDLNYRRNEYELTQITSAQPSANTFHEADFYRFALHHRLYQSLFSRYETTYQDAISTGGASEQTTHRLAFNYVKRLPGEIKFDSSYWTGLRNLKHSGSPLIFDEVHRVNEFNQFELVNPDIAIESIVITVRDPEDQITTLLPSTAFLVEKIGDERVRITIIPEQLPPGFFPTDIDRYDFLNNYKFQRGFYETTTRSYGVSFRLLLWQRMLSPYYSYSTFEQELEEGNFPGLLDDKDIHTAGLDYRYFPFSAGIRYQKIISDIDPEERWLAFVDYQREIHSYTQLYAKVEYERETFLTSRDDLQSEETKQIYSGELSVNTLLPKKQINGAAGIRYAKYTDYIESDFVSAFSALSWRIGLTEINMKASFTKSISNYGGRDTERQSTTIFAGIKRKLF